MLPPLAVQSTSGRIATSLTMEFSPGLPAADHRYSRPDWFRLLDFIPRTPSPSIGERAPASISIERAGAA